MEVTYNMTRADMWRCNLYLLRHNLGLLVILTLFSLALPGAITIKYYVTSFPQPIPIKVCVLLTYMAVVFIAMNFSIPLLCVQAAIQSRLPKPNSQRICTTIISSEGIRDITPEKDRVLSWADVTAISTHQGDFYVRTKTGGVIVPRTAFRSHDDREKYYQTALELWRHRALDQTVSISVSTALRDRLSAGETVLWQGRPFPTAYAKQKTMTALFVTFGLFVPFGLFLFVQSGVQMLGFLLSIWIIVPACLFHSLSAEQTDAQTTEYAITDKSVLSAAQPQLQASVSTSVALAQVESIQYWKRPDGIGSLEFGAAAGGVKMESIQDVSSIYAVFAAASGRQAAGVEALFALPPAGDPFASALRPGERILWQGQPDRTVYRNDFWGWMDEMVFVPGLAVLIVLIGMDFSQQVPLQEKIAVLIALMLCGGWLVRLRYQYRAREAARRIYAITNERLMILQRSKDGYFAEADLAPIQRLLRVKRMSIDPFTNTLSFGVKNAPEFAFSHLKCPEDVRQIIIGTKQPSIILK